MPASRPRRKPPGAAGAARIHARAEAGGAGLGERGTAVPIRVAYLGARVEVVERRGVPASPRRWSRWRGGGHARRGRRRARMSAGAPGAVLWDALRGALVTRARPR